MSRQKEREEKKERKVFKKALVVSKSFLTLHPAETALIFDQ